MPDNTQSMDFLADEVLVPGDRDTTYWCSHIELPVLQERQHVIRIDPIIQKGNEGVVHHFLLRECQSGLHDVIKNNMSLDCENEIMFEFSNCKKLVYGWAIGGGPLEFPDHVGYSIGGPGSPRYLQLEVHYDNPQLIEGIRDVAGIRFYYTPDIRPFEADMMEVGITTFSPWIIPPGVTDFKAYGVCDSICSDAMFADGDIKIFSVLLHAHLVGTAIRLSHYRDGKFIGDIVRDNLYDFNLQEQRILKEDWIVKPGDELLVECTYNTATRDRATFSGLSTKDEMCVAFLLYYPRVNALECGSAPDPMTLAEFLNVDISPADSFHEVIYGLDWTKERKMASADWYKKSNHMMTCTNSSEYPFIGEYIPHGPPSSMEMESLGYLVEELNNQVDETKCSSSAVQQLATWFTVTLSMIITVYVF
ncbi:DBH-like monooxygenase protein 1 [Anneissia japonica]|uniref:DBH-like monooxygenase protein 1 n=1 Tax=Anneissia japonica TaxID=1529436 RepID=UPI0014255A38|nr:DBH-like monooxygenase protein 1 [Anneissia japonica]